MENFSLRIWEGLVYCLQVKSIYIYTGKMGYYSINFSMHVYLTIIL